MPSNFNLTDRRLFLVTLASFSRWKKWVKERGWEEEIPKEE